MSSNNPSKSSRRKFLNRLAVASAGLPIAALLGKTQIVLADDAPQMSEDDPMAKALKYKHDATAIAEHSNASALCDNCMHYSGAADSEWGPCALFQGKLVNAKGWCTAWAPKP